MSIIIDQPRDLTGRFGEKPQSDAEIALPEPPDVPNVEPEALALFPADWTDADFPEEEMPHAEALTDATPRQIVGDVSLADEASWPPPPF